MIFEVICVNKENDGQVYEVAKGVSEPPAYEGQSFYRQGSRNTLLTEDDKRKLYVDKVDKSTSDLFRMIVEGELNLQPDSVDD